MPPEPAPALRQLGNYELLAKLAEGGMGSVFKARSLATGEVVAIKVVPSETARNPLLLKRFEQEFKAASLIDHPNVVKALDYCGVGPHPFLVMEFVDGETLGARVERDGPLPEGEAVRLVGQVCEGLHGAHKQGLIHRDVKPDNIMVTVDGAAKLTDLGLVKDVEGEMNLTRTGRGLGTPHFMAPEQFRNAKNADVRCDVYSLGATLYMLLTGVVPFARTSPLDCWMKKTKNDFPHPKVLSPDLSDRVNWAVCRAMAAKPEERPASCREFMEDLTGAPWQSGGQPAAAGLLRTLSDTDTVLNDLWYMVYRDETDRPHTVKGTTDGVRRNLSVGALGDPAVVLVSRTKAGPFVPLRSVPEFRDMVVASPSGTSIAAPYRAPTANAAKPGNPLPSTASLPTPSLGEAATDPTVHFPVPLAPATGSAPTLLSRAPRRSRATPAPSFDWKPVAVVVITLLAAGAGVLYYFR